MKRIEPSVKRIDPGVRLIYPSVKRIDPSVKRIDLERLERDDSAEGLALGTARFRRKARAVAVMAEKPCFRQITEGDLRELDAMVLALYAEDSYGEQMSSAKIRRTVQELARHPEKGQIVVFSVDAAVVGYAIMVYFWSNEWGGNVATLDEFYVKPAWRGRGIGTAFLSYIAAAGDASAVSLELEVTPTNDRALAYYTRQGFRPVANRHLVKQL